MKTDTVPSLAFEEWTERFELGITAIIELNAAGCRTGIPVSTEGNTGLREQETRREISVACFSINILDLPG